MALFPASGGGGFPHINGEAIKVINTQNDSYTLTQDCIMLVTQYKTTDYDARIILDDTIVLGNGISPSMGNVSFAMPVAKGQKISTRDGAGTYDIRFYPAS